MRADLYSTIHKAQRFHLYRLAEALGEADLADARETARMAEELRRLIEHLRDHARNEEGYIHPLFAALGQAPDGLDEDHEALAADLDALERLAADGRWPELYSRYNAFLGRYLLHLAEEERLQETVLWPSYRDEELLAVFRRFQAERAPSLARADLEFMLPALSVAELTRIFRGMKGAPAVFDGACRLASTTLAPPKWARLEAAVG